MAITLCNKYLFDNDKFNLKKVVYFHFKHYFLFNVNYYLKVSAWNCQKETGNPLLSYSIALDSKPNPSYFCSDSNNVCNVILLNSWKGLLHVQWMWLAFALISLFLMQFQIHDWESMCGFEWLLGYLGVLFLTLSNQLNSALVYLLPPPSRTVWESTLLSLFLHSDKAVLLHFLSLPLAL